jgi:hypothetical protein
LASRSTARAGVTLVAGPSRWRRAAALGLGCLMVLFTVAAVSALVRGLDVSCGCFGETSAPVTWLTLVQDVALASAAVALVVHERPGPVRPAEQG